MWKRCRLALNDRSWLGKLANAAVGRTLTKEEAESFDAESIIGEQVDVMVEQNEGKDKRIFNNIVSFNKTVKKLEPVEYEPKEADKEVTKTSTPATAPAKKSTKEVDDFAESLEAEREEKAPEKEAEPEDSGEAKTVEQLEKELAAAKAKAKS